MDVKLRGGTNGFLLEGDREEYRSLLVSRYPEELYASIIVTALFPDLSPTSHMLHRLGVLLYLAPDHPYLFNHEHYAGISQNSESKRMALFDYIADRLDINNDHNLELLSASSIWIQCLDDRVMLEGLSHALEESVIDPFGDKSEDYAYTIQTHVVAGYLAATGYYDEDRLSSRQAFLKSCNSLKSQLRRHLKLFKSQFKTLPSQQSINILIN